MFGIRQSDANTLVSYIQYQFWYGIGIGFYLLSLLLNIIIFLDLLLTIYYPFVPRASRVKYYRLTIFIAIVIFTIGASNYGTAWISKEFENFSFIPILLPTVLSVPIIIPITRIGAS